MYRYFFLYFSFSFSLFSILLLIEHILNIFQFDRILVYVLLDTVYTNPGGYWRDFTIQKFILRNVVPFQQLLLIFRVRLSNSYCTSKHVKGKTAETPFWGRLKTRLDTYITKIIRTKNCHAYVTPRMDISAETVSAGSNLTSQMDLWTIYMKKKNKICYFGPNGRKYMYIYKFNGVSRLYNVHH